MSEGDMTVGNYLLKNCVATGGTTQIWECTAAGSPIQLAMKLMLEEARKNSADRAVLKHEFKVGQSLEHPSFLRFHEIEINRDHAFFVMDFFRSPSLKAHITSNLFGIQSTFPKMAQALAQAFHYMHETGWLHRDIKPDNILVNRAGEVRVIDFSLAGRVKGKLGMMIAGKAKAIQGTRTYIAPETILRKPATVQTDMYSLGVTFYEVLTGHPPFAGDTPAELLKKHLAENPAEPSSLNPNVTKELDRIVLQMLKKNPKDRFETMQEIAQELGRIKCFDVDPVELHERKLQEEKELLSQSLDQRLNSRADAERSASGVKAPAKPTQKRKVDPRVLREEEKRKAREAAAASQQGTAAAPAPGQMPVPGQMPIPGQMPVPGQMPMPGMYPGMMPGMPYPGPMPMPGMPMAYPGQPMPGQPMPGQPMPGQPMPAQPMPGQPMPGQPAASPPQPAAAPPPAAAPAQAQQPAGAVPPQSPKPDTNQSNEAAEPTEATLEDMMDIMTDLDIE